MRGWSFWEREQTVSERWYEYDFAVLRLVPRVHRGECYNVGVMVYCASERFLGGRFVAEIGGQGALDCELLGKYLRGFEAVLAGNEGVGGPIAGLSRSERFHWLCAPRSDVFQAGAVHHGRCRDLECVMDELYGSFVG